MCHTMARESLSDPTSGYMSFSDPTLGYMSVGLSWLSVGVLMVVNRMYVCMSFFQEIVTA